MSDTSPKKNSMFDKILLGTAAFLAIGMMAVGPRGEAKLVPDDKDAETEPVDEKKAPVVTKASDNKKVAAIQAELQKTRQANATLEAQLRKNTIALEVLRDKNSGDPNAQALNKTKASLEAKEAELAQLKLKLASVEKGASEENKAAKAIENARAEKEELIKNLERLLKEAKSGK